VLEGGWHLYAPTHRRRYQPARSKTMYANPITRGALTCLLATAIAVPAWAQADKFVPHQEVAPVV
jgi:hypothetical protein